MTREQQNQLDQFAAELSRLSTTTSDIRGRLMEYVNREQLDFRSLHYVADVEEKLRFADVCLLRAMKPLCAVVTAEVEQ